MAVYYVLALYLQRRALQKCRATPEPQRSVLVSNVIQVVVAVGDGVEGVSAEVR
jgi:hypothetical protein